jgi:hypothetical protein
MAARSAARIPSRQALLRQAAVAALVARREVAAEVVPVARREAVEAEAAEPVARREAAAVEAAALVSQREVVAAEAAGRASRPEEAVARALQQ